MFEEYLNHRCNIYHLIDEPVNVGYGIKTSNIKKASGEPALENVACHFHVKGINSVQISQKEPYTSVDGSIKLSLPRGTDIRINDTVEDARDGLKYRAGKPMEVHGGHHIIVTLFRLEGVNSAI